jgi:hypothetical protein
MTKTQTPSSIKIDGGNTRPLPLVWQRARPRTNRPRIFHECTNMASLIRRRFVILCVDGNLLALVSLRALFAKQSLTEPGSFIGEEIATSQRTLLAMT